MLIKKNKLRLDLLKMLILLLLLTFNLSIFSTQSLAGTPPAVTPGPNTEPICGDPRSADYSCICPVNMCRISDQVHGGTAPVSSGTMPVAAANPCNGDPTASDCGSCQAVDANNDRTLDCSHDLYSTLTRDLFLKIGPIYDSYVSARQTDPNGQNTATLRNNLTSACTTFNNDVSVKDNPDKDVDIDADNTARRAFTSDHGDTISTYCGFAIGYRFSRPRDGLTNAFYACVEPKTTLPSGSITIPLGVNRPKNPNFPDSSITFSTQDMDAGIIDQTYVSQLNQFNNQPGGVRDSSKSTSYFQDIISGNPTNWRLPVGCTCTLGADGIAFWKCPNYFAQIDPDNKLSNDASCTQPLFLRRDLFNKDINGTQTAFGCLPNSLNGVVAFILRVVLALAGLIIMLIIMINMYRIITNAENPEKIAEARKRIVSGVVTLVGVFLLLTILSILGLTILDLGGLSGSLGILLGR